MDTIFSPEPYDVVVVGGSWAGLAASMQLGRARRRVLIVDGGRPRNRFAAASHGFLGQDGRSPSAILETFRTEVLSYPTVALRRDEAKQAHATGDGFLVRLASGEQVGAARLILATGVVDELPDIPGLAERWGTTVVHCPYCHGYEVADGRLGVLATDDTALHKAALLRDWSGDVTLFTNGGALPGVEEGSLAFRGVRIETRPIVAVSGEAPRLTVMVADGEPIALDALFVTSKTRLASDLPARLGCAFDEAPFGAIVRTDLRKETTVTGVFCAGDAARTPHTATWAVADGVTAGISAHQSLALGQPPALQPSGSSHA